MPNKSGTPHDIVIDGKGKGEVVQNGGVSQFSADFTAGELHVLLLGAGPRAGRHAGQAHRQVERPRPNRRSGRLDIRLTA